MKLHLVLDHGLAAPVAKALGENGHEVTGKDLSLEQFRDFTSDGPPEAEAALIDGTLGVVHRHDTVRLLGDIRIFAPDLRLIVLLPESADRDWVRSIGRLGIYDIYCTGQFSREDVLRWIAVKKTLADVRDDAPPLPGMPGAAPKLANAQPVRTVVTERIIGSVVIGVAGADTRTGCTHTALSVAAWLAQRGYAVAYAEGGRPAVSVFQTGQPSRIVPGGFMLGGIEVFESAKDVSALLTAGYAYVVLDFGSLETLNEEWAKEFVRCHLRLVTTGASLWDVARFYAAMDAWTQRYPEQGWQVLLPLADEERFTQIAASLSPKEKQLLKLAFHRGTYHAHPLQPPDWRDVLRDVLPREPEERMPWLANVRNRMSRLFHRLKKREV